MGDGKKSYWELLKDPRWQKKRAEVLQRDGFQCQKCGNKESTLNVHHMRYFYGNDPWDYPLDLLTTLCESCHETETAFKKDAIFALQTILAQHGAHSEDIEELCKLILDIPEGENLSTVFIRLRTLLVASSTGDKD